MANFVISASDVVEITMMSTYQGSKILNMFDYVMTAPGEVANGVATLEQLCDRFEQTVIRDAVPSLLSMMSTGFVINRIRAQVVHPARKPYVEGLVMDAPGEAVGAGIPSDTNVTISLRTLSAIKGTTGNKKLTGFVATVLNNGLWTQGIRDNLNAWAQVLKEQFDTVGPSSATFAPIVWSPKRPTDRRDIMAITVRPEVRVLRRRQVGLGI